MRAFEIDKLLRVQERQNSDHWINMVRSSSVYEEIETDRLIIFALKMRVAPNYEFEHFAMFWLFVKDT